MIDGIINIKKINRRRKGNYKKEEIETIQGWCGAMCMYQLHCTAKRILQNVVLITQQQLLIIIIIINKK